MIDPFDYDEFRVVVKEVCFESLVVSELDIGFIIINGKVNHSLALTESTLREDLFLT